LRKTVLLSIVFTAIVLSANTARAAEAPQASSERFAFVTSEADDSLAIIDLKTEKMIKPLPTGKTPHALVFTKTGKGYVNNRGSRDLTVINGNTFNIIKTIPLPAFSFQLALSPDGKTLAVAYKDALQISLIDTVTDTVIKTIVIGKEPGRTNKGAMMKHPYWSRDGKYLYASDNVNNTAVKININTLTIEATIALPGSNHYFHPSKDDKLLFAVNETTKEGTSVTIIDIATDRIIKDVPLLLEPGEQGLGHHGEFSRDGKFFFVCNEGGRTVSVMDVARMEVVKAIKAGMGAGHLVMTKDGRYMFIIHHKDNIVKVIDVTRQVVINTISVGTGKKQAHAAYITPDGNHLYMVNAEDNAMLKIDVAKMEVVSSIPVGKAAMYFAIKEGNDFPSTE
jgi:YVTN family beta-propeller protein